MRIIIRHIVEGSVCFSCVARSSTDRSKASRLEGHGVLVVGSGQLTLRIDQFDWVEVIW